MFNLKMMTGMLSGLITDDNLNKLFNGLMEFIRKKQAERGPEVQLILEIRPTLDNTDLYIIVWEHDNNSKTNTAILREKASDWRDARKVKNLFNELSGK